MTQPLTISVVIPAKDDAAMLDRCLAALAAQSRRADEIIVVDNASTDATSAVALSYSATVIREPRPGITAAASRGYDAASGDIIARCDADSVVASDWVASIESTFARRPSIDAVTGPATFYDLSPLANRIARGVYLGAYFAAVGAAVANPPLFGSNFAIRRSLWDRVSASVPRDNSELHDDMDLSFRIPPTATVVFESTMRVAISGRPFRDPRSFARRLRRAGTTLREHLPRELPHRRWVHKLTDRPPQPSAAPERGTP